MSDLNVENQLRLANAELNKQIALLEKARKDLAVIKISDDEASEFSESVINTIREPLIALDHDLRVVTASRSFYDFFKVTREETEGQVIYDLGNKQWDIPKLRELLEDILPEKTVFDNFEVEHDFATIGRRIMLLNARQIQRVLGKEQIILVAIEDITERRQLEILLADSEKRYRRLFETANDGILLLEKREGKIAQANPAIMSMLGYSNEEFIGNNLKDVGFPDDVGTIREIMQALEMDGIIHHKDAPIKKKTGQVIDTDVYMVDKASLIQCNIRDITERRLLNELLKKKTYDLNERVKELNCLYETSKLIADHDNSVDEIFKEVVHLLPPAFSFPKKTCARIALKEQVFITDNFRETPWKLSTDIVVSEKKLGSVEIFLLEEEQILDGGLFLKEEMALIDILSSNLGLLVKRRQAEALLIKSEETYRTLIGNILGMAYRAKPDWSTEIISNSERLCGYAADEFNTGKANWLELIHPDDKSRVFDDVTKLIKTPSEIIQEYRILVKDGSVHWVRDHKKSYFKDGVFQGIDGVVMDITEHKRAEESLRLSEEKFRKAVLTSPDAISISCLADGTYVLANQVFFELSGYTEKEVIGKTSFDIDIWENLEDRKKLIEKLSVEGSIKNFESRFRKKNGDVFFGLISASIILLDRVPHVLTITRDITERKRAEEETTKLQVQLQQAQKMEAIGTLAGGIAHDFNNILSSVLGYTELAITDLPQGSNAQDDLEEVLKAGNRAKDLVGQILAFSRQTETQFLQIQIHLIVKEALKLLRASLPATIEINENIWDFGKVLADPTQIHQVLMNLCTNASHAMTEDGGELSVSLLRVKAPEELSVPKNLSPGPYLKLTVSDTGCGIMPDVISRIFEPYFTTKELDKGTGLGLSMVQGIVQSHGGVVTVDSTPGKGSSFHVYLPEIIDPVKDTETIKKEETVFTGTERILVVDDETAIMQMLKKILGRLGYEITGRTSGIEALELFKAKPDQFDLIITDMTMPHMTGYQLARQLIEIKSDIPIILCTGFHEKISEETNKEIGIRAIVMKPILQNVLSQTIRKVLDGEE